MRIKLKNKKKIALVLSGGGFKAAAFHVGVCLALQEKGFKFAGGTKDTVQKNFPDDGSLTFRLYVGSSAGAFVSSILAAGYSLEALISAFNSQMTSYKKSSDPYSLGHLKPLGYSDVFSVNSGNILKSIPLGLLKKSIVSGGLESLIKSRFKVNGLFTSKKIAKYLADYAFSHDQFNELGVELYIVATQLNHTRKVIFGDFLESSKNDEIKFINYAKISDAVGASVSLPPVYAPYKIKDQENKDIYYFDGEIRDTLSTHVAADHGADLVISSHTYQPYHYRPEFGSLHQYGIPAIFNQALYQTLQQKINSHIQHQNDIKSIFNSIDGYMRQHNIAPEHREKILDIIKVRANYKTNVDYIYIHPNRNDSEMFFADHFSMNPEILEKTLNSGFKAAIQILRKYDI